ncbi:MAG: PEGA domain-containing protein [Patescibacteria group bacterium]
MEHESRGSIWISLLILVFLVMGTTLAILYAKGYRFNFLSGKPTVSKTGLLVTTSIPDGAAVFVNGALKTATNNTLDLAPGQYTITISKDGYFSWKKNVEIQKELVTKANALLYPVAPKLESITVTGVQTPLIDPSHTKIAYLVASQSAAKNGIYVYDMNSRSVLSLQTATKQVVSDTRGAFSTSAISWSPDGEQILATISGTLGPATYLLQANQLNTTPQNVTTILPSIQAQFKADKMQKIQSQVVGLKPALKKMIAENFTILAWSPDDTKILYVASQSADLPLIIKPRLLAVDTLYEKRQVKAGGLYVYDIKEDRNTKILDQTPSICSTDADTCDLPVTWFPDSAHFIMVNDKQIHMVDYDGANDTVVYAGPFLDNYVFPWVDGTRLVMLTNLNNSTILPNLYTISLK